MTGAKTPLRTFDAYMTVNDMDMGLDGNLYITAGVYNFIYIEPISGGTVGTITFPGGGNVSQSIISQDGSIWVVMADPAAGWANKVVKVAPSGQKTDYPMPSGASLGGMVEGSDGSIWFVSRTIGSGVRQVGRIALTGVVTMYDPPGQGTMSDLKGLALDSSGAIWVTYKTNTGLGGLIKIS